MRCALEQVIEIVTEARSCGENKILPASIYNGIKDFKVRSEIRLGEEVNVYRHGKGSRLATLVWKKEWSSCAEQVSF